VILDSCCGTGESSYWLAHAFPECCIIGIDKSLHRLSKAKHCHAQNLLQTETDAIPVTENATGQMPSNLFYERNNLLFVRADVIDFWRLVAEAAQSGRWEIRKHYVLYPNPYPKPNHLMRRWHGHPIFPVMIGLAPQTELCTNWRIYAEEFALASTTLGYTAAIEEHIAHKARTAFERKYAASGHKLYHVEIRTTTVHADRFVRSNQADGT
jgi:tRNA G46 methylase TrmB